MRKTLLLLAIILTIPEANIHAHVKIDRKSDIIISDRSTEQQTAAGILKRFISEITGYSPDIICSSTAGKGDILLASTQSIPDDSFIISVKKGYVRIDGNGKGIIYGAVTLLDDWCGVDYWGENEYDIEREDILMIPDIDTLHIPGFSYRQSQNYAMQRDTLYKWWFRLETPDEEFAGGYWVHTFDRLLPSSVYGKEHPEYYSYFNGKRHPGKASQWCLTNDEVFEIVCARIDSIFRKNPGQDLICISQNDGNGTHCRCRECSRIDSLEGSPSGTMINFLNKVAARFPDKRFATLAYLYTMNPPEHIKPAPNVIVMLCNIDCTREVPLIYSGKGQEFTKALTKWSEITDNLFVWDYGINFDNFISPFPNFHILSDNIHLFRENNATMLFSQINCPEGCDFAEMRTYLVSKLMWNPQANCDSLINVFTNGYYGEAAPYIRQYISIMEGALLGSGNRLWIYDSPVSHKYGMLKPMLLKRYNELFDCAEEAVKNDTTRLNRVRRSRMPLIYSELEIARTETAKDTVRINCLLETFREYSEKFNVTMLNERYNSPEEYCNMYAERYLPARKRPLSIGAEINYIIPPAKTYAELGKTALTDGIFGGATFADSWVGWVGKDADFIIDLGKPETIQSVSTDFLHQTGAWILTPLKVTYSYSQDGCDFYHWQTFELPEDKSVEVKFTQVTAEAGETPVNARYIRVQVTGTKICPHWHYGVGHKSWLFIDEVTVK